MRTRDAVPPYVSGSVQLRILGDIWYKGGSTSTYQGLVRSADSIIVPTESWGCREIYTTNGNAVFLCDFDPVGSCFWVCVRIV